MIYLNWHQSTYLWIRSCTGGKRQLSVDYVSVESKYKFIENGIVYDELSEEDKEVYEQTFTDDNHNMPEAIEASKLNSWVFNRDTIKAVLNTLMTDGIRIDYGQKLGKTVIFAKNHDHAEKILEVFHQEYPHLPDYAKVIDNYMTYAQSAIDEFQMQKRCPDCNFCRYVRHRN